MNSVEEARLTVTKLTPPDMPCKIARVLHALGQGQTMNRFEAERRLNDHTLNSTMAIIRKMSVVGDHLIGTWEVVKGYEDNPTKVKRYHLALTPESLSAVCSILVRSYGYSLPPHEVMPLPLGVGGANG